MAPAHISRIVYTCMKHTPCVCICLRDNSLVLVSLAAAVVFNVTAELMVPLAEWRLVFLLHASNSYFIFHQAETTCGTFECVLVVFV